MRFRRRRGGFGLRGRIVGAVLVTTVATLGVAALALLGPLEHSLRNAAKTTLEKELLSRSAIDPFKTIEPEAGKFNDSVKEVRDAQAHLATSIGATSVVLFSSMDGSGHGITLVPPPPDAVSGDDYSDVTTAWRTGERVFTFGTIHGTEYVRAAIPLHQQDAVLAVRKTINDLPGAVHAVGRAFLAAALAGLALTVLLAIPLAATLVRRLQRLRVSALQLAADGAAAPVPEDRVRDEVGDLTRTFALMQLRLQQQEAARRAFVATASHELRTPLASLDIMLELLAEDLRGGQPDLEDAEALLERARIQSKRLGRLAADLLDLSRIDADVQLRSEPVELGEMGRAVLAEFELGAGERDVRFALVERSGPVWALGDPGSIARILRILVDNALRVAPRRTEIAVVLNTDPRPSLSVIDRGPGVASEERALIFDRFKRGRDTGGEVGFGLGLAIGRELAERMGGALVLASTDGPGATFTLTLPVAQAPVEDQVPTAAPS
jgi:signal transduction histidine kinase